MMIDKNDVPDDVAKGGAPGYPLRLEHMLQPLGLDLTAMKRESVKLVRHEDKRVDVADLYRQGRFELYQSYQADHVFRRADLVISFLGRGERQALFIGVYDVLSETQGRPLALGEEGFGDKIDLKENYFYEMRRRPGFEALQDRLVIDWGPGTRRWDQWFETRERPVVELLPAGYVSAFPGYGNVLLSYDQLVSMVNFPTANREWHQTLASVAGVYLVLDKKTGKQYVGSASGKEGILGRWKDYVKNGHAGNRWLREHVEVDGSTLRHLQFSILQTLSRSLTRTEVTKVEQLMMDKLGSRARKLPDFGLN